MASSLPSTTTPPTASRARLDAPRNATNSVNTPPKTVDSASKFGPYDLLRTLGSGSFSRVKLAVGPTRDETLSTTTTPECSRHVAIKCIDKSILKSEALRLGLGREIECMEILKASTSPIPRLNDGKNHIIQLFEVVETSKEIGLVLEFVNGGDLFDAVADHPDGINEAVVKKLFKEIILAVGFMHSVGVVHRDLKLGALL